MSIRPLTQTIFLQVLVDIHVRITLQNVAAEWLVFFFIRKVFGSTLAQKRQYHVYLIWPSA
jgi:hypothetical protein